MSMYNGKYHLSNSELNDWETMCPRVWKARYIDNIFEYEPSEAMEYGSWFETLAIGSGVGGKVFTPNDKMLKSVYGPRVQKQATDCRKHFKSLGGKIISRQEYIYTEIVNSEGQVIPICGGLDVLYGFPDPLRPNLIIDLKFTGDTENDFGPYQFGNPDKINPQQGIHYKILHRAKYSEEADFEWWIFDRSPSMKQNRIGLQVSEITEAVHIEKVSRVYNEIMFAIGMDEWGYKNTYENCRDCPCKCDYQRILPDLIEITA